MIHADYDQKICQWIEENKAQILENWMELVRIPSVQSEAAPGAPYGIPCAKALDTSANLFARRGFHPSVNKESGYALIHYGTGAKIIGLFGHSDVVPAGDGWLYTQPFEPVVREGSLIGRGASDNKSGIIASLCALSALRDCQIPVSNQIQVFVGSNEENGMADIEAYVQAEPLPDISLVPDSNFPCSLGEKGILRMWAQCEKPLEAISDFRGGDAFNVVLDHVTVTLTPNALLKAELTKKLSGNSAFALSETPDGTVTLEAFGVAKHAAHPENSLNAAVLAAGLLAECENLPASDRQILKTVRAALESYYGEGLNIAHTDEDFGKLTCANGMVSMENGKLQVSLDIRYGVSQEPQELEQKLRQFWESVNFQITYMNNRAGFNAPSDSPVPQIMVETCQELTGKDWTPYRMCGGTYARYLKNAFAVGVSASDAGRTTPTLEMPAGHGGAHQRDEKVDLENFWNGVRVLTHAIIRCDECLKASEE